ncbi:MAG: DUF6387 family protein [Candidatus Ozemobacteraceae bacterium]
MGRPEIKIKIPEWFKLKQYEGVKKLDLPGWNRQLTARSWVMNILDFEPFKSLGDGIKKAIREHPLLIGDYSVNFTKKPSDCLAVAPLSVRDWYLYERFINKPVREQAQIMAADEFAKWADPGTGNYGACVDEDLGKHVLCGSEAFVKINLGVSDRILKEQFELLLSTLRDRAQKKDEDGDFSPDEKNSWVKFAVLQYIDLETWAEEERRNGNKIHITARVMADAIFPDGEGGERIVSTTTKKYAEKLMSNSFLAALAARVAQE